MRTPAWATPELDIATAVLRIEQAFQEPQSRDWLLYRLATCDAPRLREQLSERMLEMMATDRMFRVIIRHHWWVRRSLTGWRNGRWAPPRYVGRRRVCGATDGSGNVCDLHAGHYGAIHREHRGGKLWAEWRSVLPEDEPLGAQACTCRSCEHRRARDGARRGDDDLFRWNQ